MHKYLATLMMVVALGITGMATTACSDKGPAEKAGEKVDNAVDSAKDTLDNDGPAEKAGEKIDNTFDNDDN